MKYIITPPEAESTQVRVEFFNEGAENLVHQRAVNAVFSGDGVYDAEATEERVQQVAEGVHNKLLVGAIQLTDKTDTDTDNTEGQ